MSTPNEINAHLSNQLLVYVTDPATFEILWESPPFAARFRAGPERGPCHQRLFGLDQPCAYCLPFSEDMGSNPVESALAQDGGRYELSQSIINDPGGRRRVCVMHDLSEHTHLLNDAVGQISFYKQLFSFQNSLIAGRFADLAELLSFIADYFKSEALLFSADLPGLDGVWRLAPNARSSLKREGVKETLANLCGPTLGSILPGVSEEDGATLGLATDRPVLTCMSEADSEPFCILIGDPKWVSAGLDDNDASAIAGIISMAVGNAILQERIAWNSEHDILTGLYNRTKFRLATQKISADCETVGVLFFDVNDLKKYNDEIGHSAGDKLLQKMAESLTAVFTEDSLSFRLGGDEFAVLVPNARSGEGDLERLSQAWQSHLDTMNRRPDNITCVAAIGLAYGERGFSISAVLELADARMYEDKKRKKALKGERPR
ncbi:MAG: GGDEF domain-containing protein [Candidatus Adiutrix sp.]|jgi:diguanylate cyclase (GGDEF)-like protein|nr:GGDEF domain-containing protein [Candidatus Adiutrix sp.]